MDGSMGRTTALGEERVTYKPDESRIDRFVPQIAGAHSAIRPFETEDMGRVLDFDEIDNDDEEGGNSESLTEGGLMLCEYKNGADAISFTMYYFVVRGGFFFYFDYDDVDDKGPFAVFHNPPIGLIPLRDIEVEYPPGGRRVFREHAQTDARTGYEFAIAHVPKLGKNDDVEEPRAPYFLVADSLGRRERWATALRGRAARAEKPTVLRGGYTKLSKPPEAPLEKNDRKEDSEELEDEVLKESETNKAKINPKENEVVEEEVDEKKSKKKSRKDKEKEKKKFGKAEFRSNNLRKRNSGPQKSPSLRTRERDVKSVQQHIMDAGNDEELANAVVEFGTSGFSEQGWMDSFFQVHNDFDASTKCRQMEEWQGLMKKNLKGAVLEQYEYFVQASGQMTTMGREVTSLKTLIETQVETIKEMKEIDFSSAMKGTDGKDEIMGRNDLDNPDVLNKGNTDDRSAYSEFSGDDPSPEDDFVDDPNAPPIDVPDWLPEAAEEISAFVRECRYNDSIDLLLKAKTEVSDLFDKHEKPTAYRLRKSQLNELRDIQQQLEKQSSTISNRLEETLRRKNEALRQSTKRERADAHSASSAMISPCAIADDTLYLQLLVRLGRNYQAAEAYAARRTLLLVETLHERPISGSGTVDLVIYAAQLSQSFFSVLASSVEGFLDLFLSGSGGNKDNGNNEETMSVGDSSSIHSINNSKSLPAGAIAAVVLWCDSELSKFAASFGGTRVLANLALSPPPTAGRRGQPRVVGQEDVEKERQNAIKVASQCLDQAFQHASSNLDAVGLPLTPRLAECIRGRLKGCEAEVAELLDERWQGLTGEWRAPEQENGTEPGF